MSFLSLFEITIRKMILREKDRLALLDIFSRAKEPIEVWAYGSRVTGTAHEGSDLDLVIRSQDLEPLQSGTITELREIIRESNVPIWVEIRDWARLPESFRKNIEKKYEVFMAAQPSSEVAEPKAPYKK